MRALATLLVAFTLAAAAPADAPLLPLRELLGPPDVVAPLLSPDGTHLSWIAPLDGAPNLWVAPVDSLNAARAVTHEAGRGLQAFDVSGNVMYRWTTDGRRLVFPKDHDGDENWNWWVLDLPTGETRNVTPVENAQVRLLVLSADDPRRAVIGINDRDPQRHDLNLLNLDTGERTLLLRNERFAGIAVDRSLTPRLAYEVTPKGEIDVLRSGPDGTWLPLEHLAAGDAVGRRFGFDRANRTFFATSTRDNDKAALVAWDLESGAMRTLATDARVDVGGALVHLVTGAPQAYSTDFTRTSWHALDPAVKPDLDALAHAAHGDFDVVSRSRDDRRWLVHVVRDDAPEAWLLYERPSRRARPLFASRSAFAHQAFAKVHPFVIKSRDGLDLVSYVCLPPGTDPDGDGIPRAPLPTVMIVHGGPGDERAEWAFAPIVQWLADRGYAVMNVNYRGSPGFGKSFLAAERLEWGGKMNLDLVDQAEWAAAHGIADRKRIAIFGGSYGGYATLCAMTLTPGVFACAIDLVGPANLETFIATMPKSWSLDHFARRVGDPRTPEGLAHLRARSPIHFVVRVHEPMLIAQGAHDSRVVQAESDSMVAALNRQGVRVTYLLYPDEGHGFHRPGNSVGWYAIVEAFLATNLGGRSEPLRDQLDDSSVEAPVGADRVPGLGAAIAHRTAAAGGAKADH